MARVYSAAEREWRRKEVADLIGRGISGQRVADKLGVSKQTITHDRRVLGISGPSHFPPGAVDRSIAAQRAHQQERRQKVAELIREGYTTAWIAKHLEAHRDTIRKDLRELGFTKSWIVVTDEYNFEDTDEL